MGINNIFLLYIDYKLSLFFFFEKQTHTQERKEMILRQKHTTTPHIKIPVKFLISLDL